MNVNFETAKAAQENTEKKTRYIVTIGEDEEPAHAAAELQAGTVTVLITARTPEEAARIWKQSEAIRRQANG